MVWDITWFSCSSWTCGLLHIFTYIADCLYASTSSSCNFHLWNGCSQSFATGVCCLQVVRLIGRIVKAKKFNVQPKVRKCVISLEFAWNYLFNAAVDNIIHMFVAITDHPRSGVVYNFDPVCESVCMYVCQNITFKSLDVGRSYLHIRYISRKYGSVHIWRSSGQVQGHRIKKGRKSLFPQILLVRH